MIAEIDVFAPTILRKLVREIAGSSGARAVVSLPGWRVHDPVRHPVRVPR